MMHAYNKSAAMNYVMPILLFIITFYSTRTYAVSVDSESLIENCQELIAIYDKKNEKRLLAGLSTSVAEAMRAGICRGMIEEHSRHSACAVTWYEVAQNVAAQETNADAELILEGACVN